MAEQDEHASDGDAGDEHAGAGGARRVDYDAVAPDFDRRYQRDSYAGVERALLRFLGDDRARRVLEVGCGTGHWLSVLAGHGFTDLAGLDASAGMLAVAREKVAGADLRHGDAARLPWPDGALDRVFCVNALHHFPDQPAFLAQARRVLRPGGGVFSVGVDPHLGEDDWVVYDLFDGTLETDRRRYPATADLRDWITAAGFTDATSFVAQHSRRRRPAREALAQGWLGRESTSQLTLLSDEVYERGIARVWERITAAERRGDTFELYSDLRMYATVAWVP